MQVLIGGQTRIQAAMAVQEIEAQMNRSTEARFEQERRTTKERRTRLGLDENDAVLIPTLGTEGQVVWNVAQGDTLQDLTPIEGLDPAVLGLQPPLFYEFQAYGANIANACNRCDPFRDQENCMTEVPLQLQGDIDPITQEFRKSTALKTEMKRWAINLCNRATKTTDEIISTLQPLDVLPKIRSPADLKDFSAFKTELNGVKQQLRSIARLLGDDIPDVWVPEGGGCHCSIWIPGQHQTSFSSLEPSSWVGDFHEGWLDSAIGWAPEQLEDQWFQMDLGKVEQVAGVVTQGRKPNGWCNDYVSSYTVQVSTTGTEWSDIAEPFGTRSRPQTFPANDSDVEHKVQNLFDQPVSAQFVRILPLTWQSHPFLRAAVLLAPVTDMKIAELSDAEKLAAKDEFAAARKQFQLLETQMMFIADMGDYPMIVHAENLFRALAAIFAGVPALFEQESCFYCGLVCWW